MIYDDDDSRPIHYEIRANDFPAPVHPPAHPPTQETQRQIIELAQQPGWTADAVHAHFRRTRHDISLATIKWVLAQASARQRR
ncbi:hypothetical protein [Lentzea sp. NPDC060358]|uniref:hypothetical protein n=1 Tax=Lentzea sp. NPDC060358 TaxID=3347103 RepID=UPI00365B5B87